MQAQRQVYSRWTLAASVWSLLRSRPGGSRYFVYIVSAVDRAEGGPSEDRGMFQRVIDEGRGGVSHASII